MSTPIPGVRYHYSSPTETWVAPGREPLPAAPAAGSWTPAALGFTTRPSGAGYVRIEDLGVPLTGAGIRAAAVHPSAVGKVLTLPTGTFSFVDYTQGDGGKFMHGLMVNKDVNANQIRGIVGSGAGTVIQMEPNSSHFTAETALDTVGNQYLCSTIQFWGFADVEFGNLTVQGTPQPHMHHGVRINGANARVHHVRFVGASHGSFNMPPGETYSLMVSGATPIIEDCEVDGRRDGVTPISSTSVGVLGCTNVIVRRCYMHDMVSGFGIVQWLGSGMTTVDVWVHRPGTNTSGYNGAHTNHEMNSGTIRHIRPHVLLDAWWGSPRRNNGKFGHFVFLQDTIPAQSKPTAFADTQIIDPVFDTWGGIPGGFCIVEDNSITVHPKVIISGSELAPVVRPKWWEDKPTPFNTSAQFWVTGVSGDKSVWG